MFVNGQRNARCRAAASNPQKPGLWLGRRARAHRLLVAVPLVGRLVAGTRGTVLPAQSRSPATDTLPFENPPSLPEVGFVRLVTQVDGLATWQGTFQISFSWFIDKTTFLKNSFQEVRSA